ncbi:MAG: CinA family protein [Clostridia bacterium]|nr:CinA family protein [Clostridia bacterium]
MEFELVNILKNKGLTISFAESCTCGLLASKIGNVPGASSVFNESYVTYANASKMKILGVKCDTLENYGAVSWQTALEMSEGVRKISDSDIGIGITGIAGPGGGTKQKPVGLVYISIATDNKHIYEKCLFDGDRQSVRNQATNKALKMIINILKGCNNND